MTTKERRKKLGLTQRELAGIVGVSPRSILRHEAGSNTSPAVAKLLSRELDRMEKRLTKLIANQNPERN